MGAKVKMQLLHLEVPHCSLPQSQVSDTVLDFHDVAACCTFTLLRL